MKLNFNEVQRPTLDIVLNDAEQTQLTLVSPMKSQVDEFVNIFKDLVNQEKSKITMDQVYDCASKLLSKNKECKEITKEKVQSMFGVDDIVLLFKTYQEFIYGIYQLKN